MDLGLDGRIALITAASEGLGFGCAQKRVRYPSLQMLMFGSPDVRIAKTRSVWVMALLPAPCHVAGLIVVPSGG